MPPPLSSLLEVNSFKKNFSTPILNKRINFIHFYISLFWKIVRVKILPGILKDNSVDKIICIRIPNLQGTMNFRGFCILC